MRNGGELSDLEYLPVKKKSVASTNNDMAKVRCQTLTGKQLY